MNHIFKTTIKDLISRNKFFECFVCYEEFDPQNRYPMEVCSNHHYMCEECVKSRAFKCKAKNHYKCGLCLVPIKISQIRRNSFILSIKEFFQNLIDREEKSRERYKEYMENQEKIVEILIEENQLIMKESQKQNKESQKLKQKLKILEKKNLSTEQKKQEYQEKPKYIFNGSENEDKEFENLLAWKDKKIGVPSNSLFKSNILKSLIKIPKSNDFIPDLGFSNIYFDKPSHDLVSSSINPESKLSRLIQEGKKIKENLINQEHQSKIKLKESLKELQAHSKYIDNDRKQNYPKWDDKQEDIIQFVKEKQHNQGQPRKKLHIDESQNKPDNKQKDQKQERKYPSWFFIYEKN